MLVFTTKEHPFPGHKAVIKNHVGIRASRHKAAGEVLTLAEVVDGDYLFQAVPVAGYGKGHGVVLIFRPESPGGHHHDLIRHRGLRDMKLAACDHDTIFQAFFDMDIDIRVRLIGRALYPVTLDIGLGTAARRDAQLERCRYSSGRRGRFAGHWQEFHS